MKESSSSQNLQNPRHTANNKEADNNPKPLPQQNYVF